MIFEQIKQQASIIGVFFAGKRLQAARIENGVAVNMINKSVNNNESEIFIINELISVIEELFDDKIEGIGIGVPSLVDVKNGIVLKATNVPSWRKVHLKEIIEQRFNVTTFVNNDANCFAVGEKFFGAAQRYQNMVGVTVGVGLGVGIVIDGKLYSGNNCGAGEFCSIPYRDYDYEHYCSTPYFEEKYGLEYSILLERARREDKIALAIFEQFGYDFGNALKAIIYALDPEAIVVGGSLAEAYEYFEESMLKSVCTFIYPNTIHNIVIMKSQKQNIATYGAAALCFASE